jgi:hypothetical protein
MKAWLVSVALLFVLAEVLLWAKNFILPLPIYILAGAFLAIASNYDRGIMALFGQENDSSPKVMTQTATLIERTETINLNNTESLSLPHDIATETDVTKSKE